MCRLLVLFPTSWKFYSVARHSEGKPSEPPFADGETPSVPPPAAYAATGGLQERLAPKFVFTDVARMFKDQYERPHLDP